MNGSSVNTSCHLQAATFRSQVLSYRANVKLQPLAEAGAQSPDQGSTTLPSPSGSSTLEDVKSKG